MTDILEIVPPPIEVIEVVHAPVEVIEVAVGSPGAPGIVPPLSLLSDQAIGGHRVVRATATGCDYASSDDPTHMGTVVGITDSAFAGGILISVYPFKEITEPSWSFIPGPVFLGVNGLLTQTAPTIGFVQQVATAISATRIFFELQQPCKVI